MVKVFSYLLQEDLEKKRRIKSNYFFYFYFASKNTDLQGSSRLLDRIMIETMVMDITQRKLKIELTCPKCENPHEYTLKRNSIPSRPKTQCSCGKWLYPDKNQIKDLQDQLDQMTNDNLTNTDQETIDKKTSNTQVKPKTREQEQNKFQRPNNLTNIDQMTNGQKLNQDAKNQLRKIEDSQEKQLVNYISNSGVELQAFGRLIPLDKNQIISMIVVDNIDYLIEGVGYYLNAFKSRFEKYLKNSPNNPLIQKYKDNIELYSALLRIRGFKRKIKKKISKTMHLS